MKPESIDKWRLPQKSIPKIFAQLVEQYRDDIALVFGKKQWTYGTLNERANRLAHYLISLNFTPETLIAISVERSEDLVIGILGILKAGYAYVPIDPGTPTDRIAFLLSDTATPLLLTQKKLQDRFPHSVTQFYLEQEEILNQQPVDNPDIPISPNHLIYTIYTSGSTGKPKGVQIEHRQVINLVQGQIDFVQHPVKRFLYAYSFAFDGSVLLLFWTLLQGATLVIAPEELEKDLGALATFIQQQRISHLLTFPSLYGLLLREHTPEKLQTLESVSVAGEACPGALVKLHHQLLPKTKLLNQYGPTEATVGATIYETPPNFKRLKTPIGRCIERVEIYLLDEHLQQVAEGTIGEIYIGGAGVARGYLNRPALTTERFIANPFGEGRLYKTGDLGKRLPDGNLDFIGRADFQVKLRGYRIEPGEIEAVLLQHPKLQEAIVVLHGKKATEQRLVAYLVAAPPSTPNINELRGFISQYLPEYMIPASYVFLSEMPLNTSGKVDRKALPEPSRARPPLEQAYEAPNTPLEKLLVKKWEKTTRD